MVRGLHLVREVMQVAGKLLHLLNDAVQRPVERSACGMCFMAPRWRRVFVAVGQGTERPGLSGGL